MGFSAALRQEADPFWQASFEHPFVKGIARGDLPLDRFAHYIRQDAWYLSRFARVLAAAAARASDLAEAAQLARHVIAVHEVERAMHARFASRLGLGGRPEETEPAAVTQAYTSHLLAVAGGGTLGEIVAAVLPCYWLYHEIGRRFSGARPAEPIYAEWLAAYDAETFGRQVQEQIDRLDRCAAAAGPGEREAMRSHFLISSRYELLFWEMGWQKATWPLQGEGLLERRSVR